MANIFSSLGSAVKSKIDSAVSTINGDISQLTSDLNSEISRAQAAEAANLAAIQSNDTDIASNASAIATNATDISSNTSAIAAETTRAQAAESQNASDISAEATRAQAAEAQNATDIAAEITRAQNAEAANLAAIQSNDGDISNLQTQAGSLAADGNSASFSGDVSCANAVVSGNLTVSGTTTSVATVNLEISDSIMNVSKGASASTNASNDGGFVVERGSSESNVGFFWDEGADRFRAVSTSATAAASDIDAADSAMTYVEMQVSDLYLGTDNLGSLSDFTNALA